jgi:hypothetical protein
MKKSSDENELLTILIALVSQDNQSESDRRWAIDCLKSLDEDELTGISLGLQQNIFDYLSKKIPF